MSDPDAEKKEKKSKKSGKSLDEADKKEKKKEKKEKRRSGKVEAGGSGRSNGSGSARAPADLTSGASPSGSSSSLAPPAVSATATSSPRRTPKTDVTAATTPAAVETPTPTSAMPILTPVTPEASSTEKKAQVPDFIPPGSPQMKTASKSGFWGDNGPTEIEDTEIIYKEKIGGGCFGTVYRGVCRGKEVAIKKLFRQNVDLKILEEFKKEVYIMSRIPHPNVLLLMGACTTPGKMALVTELCPKGNLNSLLHGDTKVELSMYRKLLFALEMAQGMNWLHCSVPVIIHRDLKPANLLLSEDYHIKICDFGLSAVKMPEQKLQDKGKTPGSPLWMAPEVLMGKPLDEKADVYSFSIVFWEMLTANDKGREPYEAYEDFPTFKRAICKDGVRPDCHKDWHPELTKSLQSCWQEEPTLRPSFATVLSTLQDLIVNVCIRDTAGNQFWRTAFPGKHMVPWTDLAAQLAKAIQLKDGDLSQACIKALLSEGETHDKIFPDRAGEVTVEAWGKLLGWFGPFDNQMPAKVQTVLRQPWFHGMIETKEAEAKLAGQDAGTFLVRLSTSSYGTYTISKVGKNKKTSHTRIEYVPAKGFSLQVVQAKPGSTEMQKEEIVGQGPLSTFLATVAETLFLKRPLPSARYRALFEQLESSGYDQFQFVASDGKP